MQPSLRPTIGVILLTYERTEYAKMTIKSAAQHLKFAGNLYWYIADDGSSKEHFYNVFQCVQENVGYVFGFHQTHESKRGYGVNANSAWNYLHREGIDITFWLEDDWVMTRDFDLTPHFHTMSKYKIGMIRTTYIPLNITMKPVYYTDTYYLELLKDGLYTYSGNPHLKSYDFADSYGLLPEDRSPGDTEIAYDHIVRHTEGLPILVPAEIHNPPFDHIGERKSYGGSG